MAQLKRLQHRQMLKGLFDLAVRQDPQQSSNGSGRFGNIICLDDDVEQACLVTQHVPVRLYKQITAQLMSCCQVVMVTFGDFTVQSQIPRARRFVTCKKVSRINSSCCYVEPLDHVGVTLAGHCTALHIRPRRH